MKSTPLIAAMLLSTTAMGASAETLRWARAGDSITLDPHAQNEGPTHTLSQQVYEPLILRDPEGNYVPTLATDWSVNEDNPSIWTFNIREGVTFHDGAELTADDVVFSFERAMSDNSDMKELLSSISEVRAVDDYTVEFETDGPDPILPANLTNLFIMDRDWAEANGATEVQNVASGETTYASRNANGTGAYVLESREPDVRTVLSQNPDYWGMDEYPMDVTEIVYTPIQNAATRVAALLSGEVDFIQDVPVQDLGRVDGTDGLGISSTAENRTIFFGMNTAEEDLASDNVEGANPFADPRVREAMNMAIDRDAIQQVVMRGQSEPTGIIAPPFVNGWTEEMDQSYQYDVEQANALMEEAGYGDGFSTTLDCPNDRYLNDEAICQATVSMLAQIGIDATLDAVPKAQFFPLITNGETDFYMLGWAVPTLDSHNVFNFLVHSRTDGRGSWNATGFANPEVDEMIVSMESEADTEARNRTIADIWEVVQDETLYLPIHNQVLNWGMADSIEAAVDPLNQPKFKMFRMDGGA